MYSYPFKLQDFDLITQALQEESKKYLTYHLLHAWTIPYERLKTIAPSLMLQLDGLGITLESARFFSTPPGHVMTIHQDGYAEHQKYWALNLPIVNCENTSMIWHKPNNDECLFYLEGPMYSGQPIRCYPDEECTELERCEINQPTWVRIDVPHNVNNPVNSANRIILSLRFDTTRSETWHPSCLPSLVD